MMGWDGAFGPALPPLVLQLWAPCAGLQGTSPSNAMAGAGQGDFQERCLLTAAPGLASPSGRRVFSSPGAAQMPPTVTGQ